MEQNDEDRRPALLSFCRPSIQKKKQLIILHAQVSLSILVIMQVLRFTANKCSFIVSLGALRKMKLAWCFCSFYVRCIDFHWMNESMICGSTTEMSLTNYLFTVGLYYTFRCTILNQRIWLKHCCTFKKFNSILTGFITKQKILLI